MQTCLIFLPVEWSLAAILVKTRHMMFVHFASGAFGEGVWGETERSLSCWALVGGFVDYGGRGTYFAVRRLESFDLDVIDLDHLPLKTHDGHQSLDQDRVLRTLGRLLGLKLKAVRQSQRLCVRWRERISLCIFANLLGRNSRGKRRHGHWIERYAVELKTLVLGGKFHHEIALDALLPDCAILALFESERTAGAVKVDNLRLLGKRGRIERRGLVVGDFERDEEGVGGQRQGGC